MKTIAISIDESTLKAIDRIAGRGGRARSRVIRAALGEFLDRRERIEREADERRILQKHRDLLARQAEALVRLQAKP